MKNVTGWPGLIALLGTFEVVRFSQNISTLFLIQISWSYYTQKNQVRQSFSGQYLKMSRIVQILHDVFLTNLFLYVACMIRA